jgi:lipid A 3-O-deacylase
MLPGRPGINTTSRGGGERFQARSRHWLLSAPMDMRRLSHASSGLRAGTLALLLSIVPAASAASPLAPDGIDLTGGYGDNIAIYGVGVHWSSLCTCAALKSAGFDVRLLAQLAYWHGREHPATNSTIWDVSMTPILRWSGPDTGPARLFAEAGIGAHLISETRINTERVFSTAFQFGEIGVVGIGFGERHRYEIGALVQHVSNGAIKEPNNGLTYFGAVFRAPLP